MESEKGLCIDCGPLERDPCKLPVCKVRISEQQAKSGKTSAGEFNKVGVAILHTNSFAGLGAAFQRSKYPICKISGSKSHCPHGSYNHTNSNTREFLGPMCSEPEAVPYMARAIIWGSCSVVSLIIRALLFWGMYSLLLDTPTYRRSTASTRTSSPGPRKLRPQLVFALVAAADWHLLHLYLYVHISICLFFSFFLLKGPKKRDPLL